MTSPGHLRAVNARPPQSASERLIPEATVARFAIYLRVLDQFVGRDTVSSEELATASDVNPPKLRKDLSFLGSVGRRGVGYDVELLRDRIADVLGISEHRRVVIVGIGNLGHALAGYAGLAARGFEVVGLFDLDHVGERLGELTVGAVDDLRRGGDQYAGAIGVIATPASGAQQALDVLVEIGVTAVLNFAPAHLVVPDGVDVRRVDLASELQILSFHERRRSSVRDHAEGAS